MDFEFATAHRIRFAQGALNQAASLARDMGAKALVIVGRSEKRARPLLDLLHGAGLAPLTFHIPREPTLKLIEEGLSQARKADIDMVIGFGGGSAIDAGKALAALMTNPGEILDYLEVIGAGKTIGRRPLPFMAIPTTAGTGAEVTRNAVLLSEAHQVKVSLRHPWMLPEIALIDPRLTYSMPPEITASTGLDALTQLIEPFVCNQPNPLTDGLCREGLQRVARSLAPAFKNGNDAAARRDMALASLFGGLALANAKLGAVHGIAGPLGGMFPAGPHGALCARLLPGVMAANVNALKSREPDSPILARFRELSALLTGDSQASVKDGISWLGSLCATLAVAPLSAYGLTAGHIPEVVAHAQRASSMQGNPITLTDLELSGILSTAL
ncbi:MAG: iron-containing alcohol dehydrogenase [Desulfobacterales bacterium]|jgi:alcohol dehydrogenase class IV